MYKETRCNGKFIHVLADDHDILSIASGAIFRKKLQEMKVEDDIKNMNLSVTGTRGATFIETSFLANPGIQN